MNTNKFSGAKIVISVIFSLILGVSLAGCGSNVTGEWYDISCPDDNYLILTKDGHFTSGDEAGFWSEEEGNIVLVPNSGWYSSEVFRIEEYYGIDCMVGEDGEVLIQDYNKAVEIYEAEKQKRQEEYAEAQKEAEELAELDRRESYDAIMNDHFGTYYGSYNDDELQLKSDGTYFIAGCDKSSKWYHEESGTYKLTTEYDDYDIEHGVRLCMYENGGDESCYSMHSMTETCSAWIYYEDGEMCVQTSFETMEKIK